MDGYRRGRRTGPDVTLGRGLFSKFSNELFAQMNEFFYTLFVVVVSFIDVSKGRGSLVRTGVERWKRWNGKDTEEKLVPNIKHKKFPSAMVKSRLDSIAASFRTKFACM